MTDDDLEYTPILTPITALATMVDAMAVAIHNGRITVGKHGKFTARCICNDIADSILRGMSGMAPKPSLDKVMAEFAPLTPISIPDARAALAAALHERVCERMYEPPSHEPGHHGYNCDAAAILAALPPGWCGHDDAGWYLEVIARREAEISRLQAANRAVDEILVKHIIRVARYYWATGSHIETFANEARDALAPTLDDIHGTPTFGDPPV